ncbi:MAG: hypothetical protein AAF224_06835 [Pseudomonadota bacterium]
MSNKHLTHKSTLKLVVLSAISLVAMTAANAQQSTVSASLAASARADLEAAGAALDAEDYRLAKEKLNAAADIATRLDLQAIARRVAQANPVFSSESVRFALAASSTVTFEDFLKDRRTAEQIVKDEEGNIVRIRVFGEERDLSDFMFIVEDKSMVAEKGLELVEMAGEPALKRRGENGSLSVLMMSSADHALVELEGTSEAAVMAVIEQLEPRAR